MPVMKFATRCILLILLSPLMVGCAHFGDDFTAYNEKGEWWDLGYKFDLMWNQGGEPLKLMANSQDGDMRRRAIMRMSEPSDPKEREHYVTVLSTAARAERDAICRLAAVQQLSTYKDPAATQALIAAYNVPANIQDKNGVIQVAVVQALGKKKDPAAIDTLTAALDPRNQEDLRAAAAHALGQYPDYKTSSALLASLKQERSTAVRYEAHQSLVKITGRDIPPDAVAWEREFQKAASTGEPLMKEPNALIKLVNWWSE